MKSVAEERKLELQVFLRDLLNLAPEVAEVNKTEILSYFISDHA